jgi:hypothetical protein
MAGTTTVSPSHDAIQTALTGLVGPKLRPNPSRSYDDKVPGASICCQEDLSLVRCDEEDDIHH